MQIVAEIPPGRSVNLHGLKKPECPPLFPLDSNIPDDSSGELNSAEGQAPYVSEKPECPHFFFKEIAVDRTIGDVMKPLAARWLAN